MELKLTRTHKSHDWTLGILGLNGLFLAYTVEDTVREPGVKVPGKTAIPAGRFEITITWSARFQRPLPLLMNVPMFEGIRIHPGNTAADTEGCILPGATRNIEAGTVGLSVAAFTPLYEKIKAALEREKVFIEIG